MSKQDEDIQGLKVAILVDNGFEQSEMTEPRKALDEQGAKTTLISPVEGKVKSWKHTNWGDEFTVEEQLENVDPRDYDALLLPGGAMNPDKLRMKPKAVEFVKSFFDESKPVAAICHGPWTIIEAGKARGRKIASWPSLKTDLRNAGAEWQDKEVVIDGNLVTSRKPDDIPAFNKGMIEIFSKARRQRQVEPQAA